MLVLSPLPSLVLVMHHLHRPWGYPIWPMQVLNLSLIKFGQSPPHSSTFSPIQQTNTQASSKTWLYDAVDSQHRRPTSKFNLITFFGQIFDWDFTQIYAKDLGYDTLCHWTNYSIMWTRLFGFQIHKVKPVLREIWLWKVIDWLENLYVNQYTTTLMFNVFKSLS